MTPFHRLAQARGNPGRALAVSWSLLRGRFLLFRSRLIGRRVTAGKNFRLEGRLTVRGPGRVEFGDDVTVAMHVTPWTSSQDAVISIGDRCILNGTRFACADRITIGADGLIGESHIMDTSFHSTAKDRREPGATPRIAPVTIGANVWVSFNVGILPGTEIGANSVVGYGAVCSGTFPADSIIAGNPAAVVRPVRDISPGREVS